MIRRMLSDMAKHKCAVGFASVLFSCLIVAIAGPAARAESSYTANFSEKELKLEHPVDPAWDDWLMGDIGFQRMVERNSPYVELINDINSVGNITEFHLTIGDNRFNFAPVDGSNLVKLGRTTPGFSLTSSTTNSGDDLVVNIGGTGLQPGQALKFKIKLGIDPSFAAEYASKFGASLPDYRTVLFDMNGFNVYDDTTDNNTDDNAQAFVVFNPGGKSETTVFPDEEVAVSQFFNNNLRGGCCCPDDPVLIFQLEGIAPIPEPGSFALAMLGMAGFFLNSRSRGRRLPA